MNQFCYKMQSNHWAPYNHEFYEFTYCLVSGGMRDYWRFVPGLPMFSAASGFGSYYAE